MKVRCIELFSGVGAQRMALTRLMKKYPELDVEFVATAEIDKFAIKSYNAIWGETPNLGDVTKIEKLPDCDLVTWSFPCTDLSISGDQLGMVEGSGTRSALCWEVVRLLKASNRPKWLVMENVPAILHKGNKPEFDRLCKALEDLGYNNRYGVLNAADFDIAQSRKRCFMVSVLNAPVNELPVGGGLKHCMRHYLEKDVDPKYYLSEKRMEGIVRASEKERERGNGFRFETLNPDEKPAKTINTNEGHRKVCTYFYDEYRIAPIVAYVNGNRVSQRHRIYGLGERERVAIVCPTLTATDYKDMTKVMLDE